jgi:hypothetical protein
MGQIHAPNKKVDSNKVLHKANTLFQHQSIAQDAQAAISQPDAAKPAAQQQPPGVSPIGCSTQTG